MSANNVKLLLCFNDRSEVALSIPLAECTTFAIRPLKWLRFLGFAIYGREGYLSMSMNGPELDYAAQIEARSYYFMSDGEPRFADVDVFDNRTVSSGSDLSSARADFRQELVERDETCVLTGELVHDCVACHFIPHSKGDSYMSNLFNHRRETYGLVDPLDDINDTRNGILTFVGFQRILGAGYIAFLKTPNFALAVDDIPYHQPQNAGSPANRFTLQHISPSQTGSVLLRFAPHNSDARQSQDISLWPPAIIVDHCYAAAVLQAWGQPAFIEYVRANSKDSYYRGGVDAGEDASGDPITQVPNQPPARAVRYDKWSATKTPVKQRAFDTLDVVMALWTRAAREARDERRPPGNEAPDVADNENRTRIRTWLHSMEESTSGGIESKGADDGESES